MTDAPNRTAMTDGPTFWLLMAHGKPTKGLTSIVVPRSGTLVVGWNGEPDDRIWVRGPDGVDTKIKEGVTELAVQAGAAIMYQPADLKKKRTLSFKMR